uniref:Rab proteins geranylgeranyltransferase n=1 Tax=Blastobotrys adeninivorans TaxID=409370 RepID=A0A060SXT1_BLAAD
MSSYSASAANRRGSIVPPLSGVDGPTSKVPEKCDVLVCGTGIVESVLAAALAWQGSSVIHVDSNSYYGDASATLNIDQLKDWVRRVNGSQEPTFSRAMLYMPRPLQSKHYLIDLSPRIMFARSDLLSLLIKSRVANYLEFKPLSSFHTFENDSFEKVAGSKEDIFTDQSLSLITKRTLMRFIKFVLDWETQSSVWEQYKMEPIYKFLTEVFKLELPQITELVLTIGLCVALDVPTPKALARIKRYLISLDVYGAFPVLYSMYGSAGEIAQGFCRSAAVAGATYKLNSQLTDYDQETQIATFADGSRIQVSEKLVVSPTSNPYRAPQGENTRIVSRLVAVVAKDCKEWFAEGESAAVIVFPPGTLSSNNRCAVQVIIFGSGSGKCPPGQAIWYLSTVEPKNGRADLEEALAKLEQSILRESTEDFEFDDVKDSDVSYRDDGMPVLSSVKLGQSMQNFVPKEKLQFLLKLAYTQQVTTAEADMGTLIYSKRPSAEISYDGVVNQARALYVKIVGSDDDFFDVDFEDESEDERQPEEPDNGHDEFGEQMEM